MKFSEFLKDPASFIWSFLDKKQEKQSTLSTDTDKQPDVTKSTKSKKNLDFYWIFKGKTGLFIKIAVPLLLLLAFTSSLLNKPSEQPIEKPPIVDPGDTLQRPDFEQSNYLSGVSIDDFNYLYAKGSFTINQVGVRGVILNSLDVSEEADYYFPISNSEYLYYKDGSLVLSYIVETTIRESGQDVMLKEREYINVLDNVSSLSDIKWIKLSSDGFFTFVYNNVFYVYGKRAELIDEHTIKENTSFYSYYNGQIYYVERVDRFVADPPGEIPVAVEYYLVGLNANKEEIYRQMLGKKSYENNAFKVHNMYVLNDDRYLLVIEQPSEDSFFFVQMIDRQGRTLFGFTPREEVQKLTLVDHLYFSPNNNTVLMVGGGIAKLFTNTGKQLWIN